MNPAVQLMARSIPRASRAAVAGALLRLAEQASHCRPGRGQAVATAAVLLGRQIGMGTVRIAALEEAALLLDLGLSALPPDVANRSRPLTHAEEADYQLHPIRSLDLVGDIGLIPEQLNGIMHHHERIDGRGYPMGLAGHEIPEFARILAVADSFVGLTMPTAAGVAASPRGAVSELTALAGRKYDPLLVAALGAAVELNPPAV